MSVCDCDQPQLQRLTTWAHKYEQDGTLDPADLLGFEQVDLVSGKHGLEVGVMSGELLLESACGSSETL